MAGWKRDIPVCFITFNRPDVTEQAFECIREAAPKVLYHVSDAAREGNEEEARKVAECREYVDDHCDWDCRLIKVYADENMGCKNRVYTGISHVLEREKYCIIIEDDILPSQDFFPYCEELLKMYEDDPRVMMVSGINLVRSHILDKPYTFSCFPGIWGWATWARAWKEYDPDVSDWPQRKADGSLVGIFGKKRYFFHKRDIESVYTKKKDTWDIQWDYCRHVHGGLGIVPRENMIRNIGFDRDDATHTKGHNDDDFSYGDMTFPLPKLTEIKRDIEYDRAYLKKFFGLKKITGFIKKKVGLDR